MHHNATDLLAASMTWLDGHWDEAAALVRAPGELVYERAAPGATIHLVRETTTYALGLLARNAPGDEPRALRALDAVLANQFDAPGTPFHGTWRRAPEEPDPPEAPVVWIDYDPNWREFIGTALALLLIEDEPRLPPALVARIDAALRRAVDGTLARAVPASYTNIALMCAFLLDYAGARFGNPAWRSQAEQYAAEIHRLFSRHGAFDEYNSPTYYGVDLYALALWRKLAPSPRLREAGAAMEAALWRDIARYYHAGMRNLAGPYDRSYGMDLRRYAGLLGLWIWLAAGRAHAPFPDPDHPFEHSWDFGAAPAYALLGAVVPTDALPHFLAFQGERSVEQVLADNPRRVATAWVGERLLIGAEAGGGEARSSQFHPATLHWQLPDSTVGWLRLRAQGAVDARAEPGVLALTYSGGATQVAFEIFAPGATAAAVVRTHWELPGLAVGVETDAGALTVHERDDGLELRYRVEERPARFLLRVEAVPGG
jgi:hypothetical protein